MQEAIKTLVTGHVLIKDSLGNELVNQFNAIHPKNMATAIARGLSNAPNFQVFKMKLGNRGTYIDGTQQIVFNPPITSGDGVDLYGATYVEIVDDGHSSSNAGNSVTFTNIPASTNTRVIVTCVISANEAFENPSDTIPGATDITVAPGQIQGGNDESPFFFDELGLFTRGTVGDYEKEGELMLSHLIFSPIEHTGNRELVIVYTLTISVS